MRGPIENKGEDFLRRRHNCTRLVWEWYSLTWLKIAWLEPQPQQLTLVQVQVLTPSVESDCFVPARRGMSSQKSPSVGSAHCLVLPSIVSMMQSSIFQPVFAQN